MIGWVLAAISKFRFGRGVITGAYSHPKGGQASADMENRIDIGIGNREWKASPAFFFALFIPTRLQFLFDWNGMRLAEGFVFPRFGAPLFSRSDSGQSPILVRFG